MPVASRPHVTIPHVRGIRLAAPNDLQSRRSTRVRRRLAAPTRGHDNGCRSRTRVPWRTPLLHVEDESNRRREARPLVGLGRELPAAEFREFVVLRLPIVLGRPPFGCDPATPFKSVQGRIYRPLRDLQHRFRHLAEALGDRPTEHGVERQHFENEQIEGALRQLETFRGHRWTLYTSTGGRLYTGSCRSARGVSNVRLQPMVAGRGGQGFERRYRSPEPRASVASFIRIPNSKFRIPNCESSDIELLRFIRPLHDEPEPRRGV